MMNYVIVGGLLASCVVAVLVWRSILQSNREDALGEHSEATHEAWERRMKGD